MFWLECVCVCLCVSVCWFLCACVFHFSCAPDRSDNTLRETNCILIIVYLEPTTAPSSPRILLQTATTPNSNSAKQQQRQTATAPNSNNAVIAFARRIASAQARFAAHEGMNLLIAGRSSNFLILKHLIGSFLCLTHI